jgi:hypothetical protein
MRYTFCRSVGPVMEHVVLIESTIPAEEYPKTNSSRLEPAQWSLEHDNCRI